jgi:hypothetical protein
MSKGYGKMQRAILDVFEAKPDELLDTITIAALAYGENPVSNAQASSVRRSLRKLVDAGEVVDLGRGWRDRRRRFALPHKATEYRQRVADMTGARGAP